MIALFTHLLESPFQSTTISLGFSGIAREVLTDSFGLVSCTAFQRYDPVNFGCNDGGDLLCEHFQYAGWCSEQYRPTKCVFEHLVVYIFQHAVCMW